MAVGGEHSLSTPASSVGRGSTWLCGIESWLAADIVGGQLFLAKDYPVSKGFESGLGWCEQMMPYFARPDSPVYHYLSIPVNAINYFLNAR
jgi:hypothetical protein